MAYSKRDPHGHGTINRPIGRRRSDFNVHEGQAGWCSVGNPPLGVKELFLYISSGLKQMWHGKPAV